MVRFVCPRCKKVYQAEDDAVGKKAKCSQCGVTIVITNPASKSTAGPANLSAVAKADVPEKDADIYNLVTEPVVHQSDTGSTLPVPGRMSPIAVQLRRRSHASKRNGPSMVLMAIGGFVLIGITVASTLWVAGNRTVSNGSSNETARSGSMPVVTPSGPSQYAVPPPQPSESTTIRAVPVSGELFVTTKRGDVKKAAGQRLHFTLITAEVRKKLASLLAKADQTQAHLVQIQNKYSEKHDLGWDMDNDPTMSDLKARMAAYANEPELKNARAALETVVDDIQNTLLAGATSPVASSEGKFQVELQPRQYVLWTAPRTMADQSFSWCTGVLVQNTPINLVLSEREIFLYSIKDAESDPMHRLLRQIVFELGAQ